VLIEGATSETDRVERERRWRAGEVKTLITKPAIYGFGINWQHCSEVYYLGLGYSYEQFYQTVRRVWRFGQRRPVHAYIVVSEAEADVVATIRRKEQDAQAMAAGIVAHMKGAMMDELSETIGRAEYVEDEATGDGWRLMLGDAVERLRDVKPESVGLWVFSPAFASLYTYSASDRDMGNCSSFAEFSEHYWHFSEALIRATMPGRRACVHVQQVALKKAVDGVIGWYDFRADVVRTMVEAGWIYDGEVVIDKDPQAQAIRTKSKQLMFVQKNKDSAWSRPAMADYILLFRAPGENPQPVKTDVSNEEWIQWARPVWYGIKESDTLNVAEARSERDERHICPLQLGTIERCVRLWSNPGDVVGSPFAGIGSEGYKALQLDRRFVGIELKRAYWEVARKNLDAAKQQYMLLPGVTDAV
jgi:DNA modification methylase